MDNQRDLTETMRMRKLYAQRMRSKSAGVGDHVTPEAILAVVMREGPEAERLATLEHVMSCPACHREYEWLTAVNEAGLQASAEGAGPVRRPWWRGRALALAASLVMAVGAALAVSSVLRSGPERVRGASGDIELLTPGPSAAAGTPLAFSWRAAPGVSRYVLEVQRADGSVALADTTTDTTATITPGRLQPDTTYRWWVREVTDGAEPRSSALRELRITSR
jgi:hypothetical protein